MNSKYFRYLFRSFWSTLIVYISLFAIFLVFIPVVCDTFMASLNMLYEPAYKLYAVAAAYVAIFLSGILPFLLHGRYWSKNRSDIILSMPMTRNQAFITEAIFGLLIICGLTIAGYFIGSALDIAIAGKISTLDEIVEFLPVFLLTCIVTYMSMLFAVSVSNSSLQAFIMAGIVIGVPYLIHALFTAVPTLYAGRYAEYHMAEYYLRVNWISQYDLLSHYLHPYTYNYRGIYEKDQLAFLLTCLALLGNVIIWGGMDVLAYFQFKKLKSEHLGTVIPQRFGAVNSITLVYFLIYALAGGLFVYLIMNPYGFAYLIAFLYLLGAFLIMCTYWIAIFVVRRKAKFRRDDWVRFIIAMLGGFAFGVVVYFLTALIASSAFPPIKSTNDTIIGSSALLLSVIIK